MFRRVSIVDGQSRRMDGGIVFGSVPQRIWAEWVRPDHKNLVDLPSRVLLVQQNDQNILVLSGCEMLLPPLPRKCSCQRHSHILLEGLARLGLGEDDIHTVVLTHLQSILAPEMQDFVRDGSVARLLFRRARYLVGERHWFRALRPHPRDRALFVPQIMAHLEASGRLDMLSTSTYAPVGDDWKFHISDGSTPGQLIPEIQTPGGPLIFAGDLIPGTHWLQLEVTSGYDRNPECLIEEKEQLLDHLVASKGRLVLSRDPRVAMIRVARDRQSRYQPYDEHLSLLRLEA
ncbi:MBL fold metallo-hydrolase [Pseudomonas sp. CR3202]